MYMENESSSCKLKNRKKFVSCHLKCNFHFNDFQLVHMYNKKNVKVVKLFFFQCLLDLIFVFSLLKIQNILFKQALIKKIDLATSYSKYIHINLFLMQSVAK